MQHYTQSPIFSIAYLGEAGPRAHRVIYGGGGGSSKSGVGNAIIAAEVDAFGVVELCRLDTGAELCSFVCVGRKNTMLVSVFNDSFRLCKLRGLGPGSHGQEQIVLASDTYVSDTKTIDPSINCCAVDGGGGSLVAVGGDDGVLRLWAVSDEEEGRFGCTLAKSCSPAHDAPITDCCFSESSHLVATASKDGTCRVWSIGTGAIMCKLLVRSTMPSSQTDDCRSPHAAAKLIVRACKFVGDDVLVSVQSAARGSAHAAKWTLAARDDDGGVTLTACLAASRRISRHPVSAACLEHGLLAHGDTEGSIGFVRAEDLRHLGRAVQVHELPVTGLVLSRATNSMPSCAFSVSADYKVALTPLIRTALETAVLYMSIFVVVLAVALSALPGLVKKSYPR